MFLNIILVLAVVCAAVFMLLTGWTTAWYHILVFLGMCIVFVVLGVLGYACFLLLWSLFLNKKKEVNKVSRFYSLIVRETMIMLLFFSRARVHIEGKEKLPKDTKFLLVANHRSNYDPITSVVKFGRNDMIFVSKPENFNIPIAGAFMHKAGFIPIDRDNPKNALVTINKAAEYLKNQEASVGIFPEGTRNRTDATLLEFKNGAFKIATKAQVPIVVVAMKNMGQVKKNFPWKSTKVSAKIVDVITKEEVMASNTAELSRRAREAMLTYLES